MCLLEADPLRRRSGGWERSELPPPTQQTPTYTTQPRRQPPPKKRPPRRGHPSRRAAAPHKGPRPSKRQPPPRESPEPQAPPRGTRTQHTPQGNTPLRHNHLPTTGRPPQRGKPSLPLQPPPPPSSPCCRALPVSPLPTLAPPRSTPGSAGLPCAVGGGWVGVPLGSRGVRGRGEVARDGLGVWLCGVGGVRGVLGCGQVVATQCCSEVGRGGCLAGVPVGVGGLWGCALSSLGVGSLEGSVSCGGGRGSGFPWVFLGLVRPAPGEGVLGGEGCAPCGGGRWLLKNLRSQPTPSLRSGGPPRDGCL